MIHYHGCSDWGRKVDAARALKGRHVLVSHAYPHHLASLAEVCPSFCLDNGAFTAWRKGTPMDIQGYLKWVDEWRRHPGFDWALIPDKIDGNEDDNARLMREWPSDWKAIGVPIWHLHESLERLKSLSHSWRRIALGSSGKWRTPGTPAWWLRMTEAMTAVCDTEGRPRCKLHGLRMLSPSIFRHLPLASADSTHVLRTTHDKRGCWNGAYAPIDIAVRAWVLIDRTESYQSATTWQGVPRRIKERIATPLFKEQA